MISFFLTLSMCAGILSYDPPGRYYDITEESKQRACALMPHIISHSYLNDVDPKLLTALIIVESRFKPAAVSKSNACGLTQVIPKWTGGRATKRKKYTCSQLKNPEVSIEAGSSILSWWIRHRKGNVRKGLCGYNAGFRGCTAGGRYADAVLKVQRYLN